MNHCNMAMGMSAGFLQGRNPERRISGKEIKERWVFRREEKCTLREYGSGRKAGCAASMCVAAMLTYQGQLVVRYSSNTDKRSTCFQATSIIIAMHFPGW